MKPSRAPLVAAPIFIAIFAMAITAQQPGPSGVYTQQQAEAGRMAYEASCAGCHGMNLTGSSDASPLTGPNFANAWGSRPVSDLFNHTMETMPPAAAWGTRRGSDAQHRGVSDSTNGRCPRLSGAHARNHRHARCSADGPRGRRRLNGTWCWNRKWPGSRRGDSDSRRNSQR